jgi:hypothetical protein
VLLFAAWCAPSALAVPADVTLAYSRDAAEFLKRHHASAIRNKGTFTARKFGLMSDSAIGFFRGSAPLFYRDISDHPSLASGVAIPLMGDLHLENASAFALPGGVTTFDLDDFDEAVTGPYTWDLARALVSVRLFAQEANLSKAATDRLVTRFISSYLAQANGLKRSPASLKEPVVPAAVPGPAAEAIQKAQKQRPAEQRRRWTKGGKLVSSKKVIPVELGTLKGISSSLDAYTLQRKEPAGFFRVKDVARRMAGLASLSRQRYLVVVEGPTGSADDDVLLELKEQGPAAAAAYLPDTRGSQAERVRRAWQYFLPDSDPFLGTAPGGGADFLVRSLPLQRSSVDVESLRTEPRFSQYVDAIALLTARAHARSGRLDDIIKDAVSPQSLTQRLNGFSVAYAKQVEADREIWKTYIDP